MRGTGFQGVFLYLKIRIMIYLKLIDDDGNELEVCKDINDRLCVSILNSHGTTYYSMNDFDIEQLLNFIKLMNNE